MHVLMHDAPAGATRDRLKLAAAGLALRGHRVTWSGGGSPPADLPRAGSLLALARTRADVVVGGSGAPRAVAAAGLLAQARALLFDLEPARVARWSVIDRWACGVAYAAGLVEEREADAIRGAGHAVPLDRVGLWPEDPAPSAPDAGHPDTEVLERACERALRRARGRAPVPAAFLDRDGTLVVERGYLADPDHIELLPGVPEALHELHAAGYLLVVVSNQSGVGRGLYTLASVHAAMARLREALRRHGVEPDAIYFCPHRPEDGCACRKPGTALLERAADDLELSLARSVMIGDKLIDAATGRRAGGRGLLVRTGYGREEERRIGREALEQPPDAVVEDLRAAAEWALRHPLSSALD
jgi:D-glycero-D-manno-heptose 1,7-bisphosphate phosphatase